MKRLQLSIGKALAQHALATVVTLAACGAQAQTAITFQLNWVAGGSNAGIHIHPSCKDARGQTFRAGCADGFHPRARAH